MEDIQYSAWGSGKRTGSGLGRLTLMLAEKEEVWAPQPDWTVCHNLFTKLAVYKENCTHGLSCISLENLRHFRDIFQM